MSERTFIRKYKDKTGKSPAQSVEHIRVEAAKQLLANSGTTIKEVSELMFNPLSSRGAQRLILGVLSLRASGLV